MIQTPKTSAVYQVDILQALADTGIRQFSAGGKARAYCDIVADKLGEMEAREFLNLGETLLPFATGQNLDFIGEIFGVHRLGQEVASVASTDKSFKFYVTSKTFGSIPGWKTDLTVPAGTRITTTADGTGQIYLTDAPVPLPHDDTEAYFSATCASPGDIGNAAAGVFTFHNYQVPGDPYGSLKVTNQYGITGGRDEEDDNNFRYRISLKIQSQNGANEAALRFELLQIPGIQDIVFNRYAGTFDCYVYSVAPQTASSLLDLVQQTLNDKVAFPLTGNALAPDLVGFSLSTTLSLSSGLSATDQDVIVGAAVAAAQDYIDNLRIGETLVINEIADRIRNADARIVDVGQPNRQIPEIFIWRSRADGSRYSRFLLGNYTPQLGERVVVEVHDGLTNPINLAVA